VGYWFRLFCDHVIPGTLCVVVAMVHMLTIYTLLVSSGQTDALDSTSRGWLAIQEALTALFFLLAAYYFTTRLPRRGPRAGPLGIAVALGGTVVLSLQALLPTTAPAPDRTVPSTILLIGGMVYAYYALVSLGPHFGIFPEARGLVTEGPYAHVRHPLYLAEIVIAVAIAIPTFSFVSAGFLVAFAALQYARAVLEERAILQTFPEYGEYARDTWRIIPGLH
jgi:protein-S-isoprenylcysteine O-methyltransferase Ste14